MTITIPTRGTAPSLTFERATTLKVREVFAVAHNVGDRVRDGGSPIPTHPHPDDQVLSAIELGSPVHPTALALTFSTPRRSIRALRIGLADLDRRLAEQQLCPSRQIVCRICDTFIGNADNPPPTGRCPHCYSTAVDVIEIDLGGDDDELRVAASGGVGASSESSNGKAVQS